MGRRIQLTIHLPNEALDVQVTVPGSTRPYDLINRLKRDNYLSRTGGAAIYKLMDEATNRELFDLEPLSAAGIGPVARLRVTRVVAGA
jgi:hypothetical protein